MNKLASSSSNLPSLRFIKRRSRQGLTLIELLIAVGLTLVIVAAMIRAFKTSSESISLGRTKMDMHNQIRVASEQLRRDLQNATHVPHPRASTSEGYFEFVEGDETDRDHATTQRSFIGDHDDVLALTVRSDGVPFRGRFLVDDNGTVGDYSDDTYQQIESYLAEIVWYSVHMGGDNYDGQYRLYRRVLLIRPDLTPNYPTSGFANFYEANDISVRRDDMGNLVANSLEDLAPRQNRYAHNRAIFPHEIQSDWLKERVLGEVQDPDNNYDPWANPDRQGEDLMLDHCVSFDIKVFDPTAEVFIPSEVGLSVGQVIDWDDPGFSDVISTYPPIANLTAYPQNGAYVNLAYDPWSFDGNGDYDTRTFDEDRWFSSRPWPMKLPRPPGNSPLPYTWEAKTWCTWWEGYESDGLDQDASLDIDQGVDGIDNNSDGIIDDNEERETRPPYAYPIRSLEVRIRMIEKKSNLILQKTVRESFVPN